MVEDEPSAARMLAKGLREEAYAVDVAGDGERALGLAYLNDYDLVVLDVMLLARVRALLRRRPALYPEVINVADLSLDTRARRARRGGATWNSRPRSTRSWSTSRGGPTSRRWRSSTGSRRRR